MDERRRWNGLAFAEDNVPDAVAQLQAPVFELGERAVIGTGRETSGSIHEARLARAHIEHLLAVLLPIGRLNTSSCV